VENRTVMNSSVTPSKWDAHAADYRRLFAPLTGYVAQGMLRMVEARLPAGAAILDIACGPGDLAVAAGRHLRRSGGGEGRVLAVDRSAAMVALSREAISAAGLDAVVDCVVGDGQALQPDDETFDAAFSSFGIFLFPDRALGWREAARVLKSGGLFVTSAWCSPENNELAQVQIEPMMASLPKRLVEEQSRSDWEALLTREGLIEEVCAAAPFVDAEVSEFGATIALPRPMEMWLGMLGNPVTDELLSACTPVELARVKRAVLERLEKIAGGADRPVLLSSSCHILVARRA